MTIFIFDLDGTVTKREALPIIANHFNIKEDIDTLTQETISGNIPFIESFIRRVHILGKLPVDEVSILLSSIEFYDVVFSFIKKNIDNCVIATGNLDCWIDRLVGRIGCKCFSSHALLEGNTVAKLSRILKKEDVVRYYKNKGYMVVYIGEGNNDAEAMRIADISIASGLTHQPSMSVMSLADYVVYSEEALCKLLKRLS